MPERLEQLPSDLCHLIFAALLDARSICRAARVRRAHVAPHSASAIPGLERDARARTLRRERGRLPTQCSLCLPRVLSASALTFASCAIEQVEAHAYGVTLA